MTAGNYMPIATSDHRRPQREDFIIRLQKMLIILVAVLIVSYILAQSAVVLFYGNGIELHFPGDPSNSNSVVALKSLTENNVLPPIHGEFHCAKGVIEPSSISPIDANRVRPADIQYIAAMGDSYVTGFDEYTPHVGHTNDSFNFVGNSFIMGGDGLLENHLTLANILRHLNPSLIGASTGRGLQEAETNLNVAIPGMWASDMPRQAREIIRRMQKYSKQSTLNDWKLVNIFVGTKDISGFCMGEFGTTKAEYKGNLTEAIQILQEALPKTIISIIGMTNLDFMWRADILINNSPSPCNIDNFELLAQRRMEEYQEVVVELVDSFKLSNRKDQAIIGQHIFHDLWLPLRKNDGSFNAPFYSKDTFHLSNYGNSLVAKQLWKHLISPGSRKITNNGMMSDDSPRLLCPEADCPFIRTPTNSIDCA